MSSGTEDSCSGEITADAPGDIQVIVHGETFPAKKLRKDTSPASETGVKNAPAGKSYGCFEVGDWLTDVQLQELRKLMSFPVENTATVFQIVVNVPPMRRLICEWPHGSSGREDKYYFTQLADLDG
jgi:hypothetical protein